MSRPRFERFLRNLAHWCSLLITTCPGIDIALEEGFDQAGKAGFGVLHASQLVGHAARLLYLLCLIVHNYRLLVKKDYQLDMTMYESRFTEGKNIGACSTCCNSWQRIRL